MQINSVGAVVVLGFGLGSFGLQGCFASSEETERMTQGIGGLTGVGCSTTVSAPGNVKVSFQDAYSVSGSSFGGLSYLGTEDATIDSTHPNTNYGSGGASLFVDSVRSSVLRWDVSSILPTATVVDACVSVNVNDPSNDFVSVYELKRSWSESTVTWNFPWLGPGATNSLDRNSTPLLSFPTPVTGQYSGPIPVPLAQKWVAHAAQNFGLIASTGVSNDSMSFQSSEATGSSSHPALTLIYHP
jgi:hypothetical protein